MLKIDKLHKSYKMGDSSLHVLKGINLNVNKGSEVLAAKLSTSVERYDFAIRHIFCTLIC